MTSSYAVPSPSQPPKGADRSSHGEAEPPLQRPVYANPQSVVIPSADSAQTRGAAGVGGRGRVG